MPQEKPKKSVAVRDSIPLSTTPNPVNTSWGGAWVAPAVGANSLKTSNKTASVKNDGNSTGRKALEAYKKRISSK